MEKKKWHRSPGIKGLLLLFQYIFLGAVIFSGLFLITSLAHGLRLSDSGKDYLDSTAFANTLYDAAYDVMYGISGTFPYTNVSWKGLAQNEASQSSDKNASSEAHASLIQTSASQVVDLNEIANDEEISFQNTSGLAYSVSDLEKWAQDFDTSSGNPIVICHQASSAGESLSRHYYYVQDFLEKIDSGELDFSVDMEYYGFSDSATEIASYDENLKQLIEDIKYDMQYGVMDDLSGIQITSGDGKVLWNLRLPKSGDIWSGLAALQIFLWRKSWEWTSLSTIEIKRSFQLESQKTAELLPDFMPAVPTVLLRTGIVLLG